MMLAAQHHPRSIIVTSPPQHHTQQPHTQELFFDDYYPRSLELDLDSDINSSVGASSPLSTHSFLSQYSHDSLADLHGLPALGSSSPLMPGLVDTSMPTDTWMLAHRTPKTPGRASHHRESSLSSMGSAGPASPYSHNTSNPQIAVTDDGYSNMAFYDDGSSAYQLSNKANLDTFYTNHTGYVPEGAVAPVYPNMLTAQKHKAHDRGLLPPPELSGGSNRPRPVSVASSVASVDSPATPVSEQPEDDGRGRKTGERRQAFLPPSLLSNSYSRDSTGTAYQSVPKLDRTMSDIYSDELYNPNFTITSTAPSQGSQAVVTSPSNEMFAQRLQAINNQHLNAAQTPATSAKRGVSPFQSGSPHAPTAVHDFAAGLTGAPTAQQLRYGSAQQLREQQKAENDAQALRQQLARNADTSTPQTISPKDAMLDFSDADAGDSNYSLFAPQSTGADYNSLQMNRPVADQQTQAFLQGISNGSFNFMAPTQMSASLQIPQQYPFIARPQQQQQQQATSVGSSVPSRVSSADSTQSGQSRSTVPTRPASTTADGGTYTCTYHGCTLRFETPALLQKHKREGHRQAHGLTGVRPTPAPVSGGMTSALLNSQAGPHRCDRINPSTGKPCNTIFSRPYDLTRHEDTIHNARKQKVRCELCTEEKTFSRADALTRHFRVCHPEVEVPGKHRRRP